jgi:Protein of unknown function (DUF2568)
MNEDGVGHRGHNTLVQAFLAPFAGVAELGRRASFRCSWPNGRGGSIPSARILDVYANDGLRFLLELAALASLAYFGFTEFDGAAQWLVGVGAPSLVAVVWGRFVSPRASHPQVDPPRLLLEVAVFGSGAAALLAAGRTALGLVLAGLAVLHLGLTFALGQRPAQPVP